MIIIGIVLSLAFIWAVGLMLINLLPRSAFGERDDRLIAALFSGLAVTGLAGLIAARVLDGSPWFLFGLVAATPALAVVMFALRVGQIRRRRHVGVPGRHRPDPLGRHRISGAWASSVVLAVGVGALVAFRPMPAVGIEVYGEPADPGWSVVVVGSPETQGEYVIVLQVRDGSSSTVPIGRIDQQPQALRVAESISGPVRVELYLAGSEGQGRPLRILDLPGP